MQRGTQRPSHSVAGQVAAQMIWAIVAALNALACDPYILPTVTTEGQDLWPQGRLSYSEARHIVTQIIWAIIASLNTFACAPFHLAYQRGQAVPRIDKLLYKLYGPMSQA
ncbi:hypothetical protein F4777DRAFT_90805 [Nemania sp. FL0916]|nr:hypothetical protein F4777DRAFT_90805 [Nemania sp. FL0916]